MGRFLTEDLNLSVKILINGEQIRYCGETAVYQEAVTDWSSFFRQRTRCAIGNFETIFIYLPKILKSKLPLTKNMELLNMFRFMHLTYSYSLDLLLVWLI